MKPILQTERLFLRELNVGDAGSFYELNFYENVIRYTGDRSFENVEEAARFLQNYKDYETNGYGRWAVIDKSNGAFWAGAVSNILKTLMKPILALGFLSTTGIRAMLLKAQEPA